MDDKKATPDDYITGLKNALVFHQSQVDKYNLAIHAFEEGYKVGHTKGVTEAYDNQKLASNSQNVGD